MAKLISMWTGADGESHFEISDTVQIPRRSADAVRYEMSPPRSALDWHVAPCDQYVITLNGTLEFTTREGDSFKMGPGDVLLVRDTVGGGHKWRLIDDQPWERVYVELASE